MKDLSNPNASSRSHETATQLRPSKAGKAEKAAKGKRAGKAKRIKPRISHKRVRSFVNELFGPTEHAKRVQSLANAVVGITQVAVLAIHAIGQAD
jgi:hypothetical protein